MLTVSKIVQHRKVPISKPDNLSLIVGSHMVEGKTRFPEIVYTHNILM